MKVSLKHYIRTHEGSRLMPYVDSGGCTTIGVGRNLTDVGITQDEEELLLENDIRRAERAVEALTGMNRVSDPTSRFTALCDMAFNLGQPRLARFRKMLAAIKRNDWERASREALRSDWRLQVGERAYRDAYLLKYDRLPNKAELAEFAGLERSLGR